MIFLAVGTQFGFDRLVRAVDKIVEQKLIQDEVFAQIGPGQYKPAAMKYVVNLEKEEFDKTFNSCNAMISHAGMGNISLALKANKPLLVLPRLKQYGEVVNNHQVDTAKKFEHLDHILVAYNENELIDKIKLLKTFVPKTRIPNRQRVIDRIEFFLRTLKNEHL
jgi:UDP-N-acetylglucosamine transferase subunit ALG13